MTLVVVLIESTDYFVLRHRSYIDQGAVATAFKSIAFFFDGLTIHLQFTGVAAEAGIAGSGRYECIILNVSS